MSSDYGIKISPPQIDARTATNLQLLLNMQYPIAKLDSTNPVSFQDVTLTFANDPPESVGASVLTTVYTFKHGYNYVPQVWAMMTVLVPPTSRPIEQLYNQNFLTLALTTPFDTAVMYVKADATNVYFIVDKSRFGGGGANPLQPCVVRVRTYVFVQDTSS